jgi:hypothetical protein
VLVVVPFVGGVAMAAVHVVDMIAMLHLVVPAALAMRVGMLLGRHMLIKGTFVVVALVGMMGVTFVQVVDMVLVSHACVPTRFAVLVVVAREGLVPGCGGHRRPSPLCVRVLNPGYDRFAAAGRLGLPVHGRSWLADEYTALPAPAVPKLETGRRRSRNGGGTDHDPAAEACRAGTSITLPRPGNPSSVPADVCDRLERVRRTLSAQAFHAAPPAHRPVEMSQHALPSRLPENRRQL